MTESKNQTVLESIADLFELTAPSHMTAYKLAKYANEVLSAVGLKNIPTQMTYNYVSKGLIKSVVKDGQVLVERQVASDWLVKYMTKKLTD